jgi:hypothetical protein
MNSSKCPKCDGTVIREWVPEAIEEEYQLRCLNCGWVASAASEQHSRELEALLAECCCHTRKNGAIGTR